jgi:hypothetical protein
VHTRDPATRNVARVPGEIPTETLKFEKMWIVYNTLFYCQRVPVERRVTVGTPHLRTPRDFENHGSAVGTRFRILLQEFHGFYIFGEARVFVAFDFVALVANFIVAHLTLPLGRQEPPTLAHGTLSNKFALLVGQGLIRERHVRPTQFNYRFFETHDSHIVFTDQTSHFFPMRQDSLSIRKKTLFTFEKNILSMIFQLMIPERLCTCRIYEFAIPYILALHTMWIGRNLGEVLLNTCPATF